MKAERIDERGRKCIDASNIDIIEVHGVEVSTKFFKWLGEEANKGSLFRVVRNDDGVVTLECVNKVLTVDHPGTK